MGAGTGDGTTGGAASPPRRLPLAAALLGLAALAACGPVPVEQAERSCAADLHAARPETRVAMGITAGPGGVRPHAGLSVSLSSDSVMGVDPSETFNRCVMRRSGQMPRRPLAEQPLVRG